MLCNLCTYLIRTFNQINIDISLGINSHPHPNDSIRRLATFPDTGGGLNDSRQCLKEASPASTTIDIPMTGNHLDIPRSGGDNPNLLSPETINQRRNSRRPSILPVPDMFTSSTLNISQDTADEGDESDDELEDDVPWRSPSEKIA